MNVPHLLYSCDTPPLLLRCICSLSRKSTKPLCY